MQFTSFAKIINYIKRSWSGRPSLIPLSRSEKQVFIYLLIFCLSHHNTRSLRTEIIAVLAIASLLVPKMVNTGDARCVSVP